MKKSDHECSTFTSPLMGSHPEMPESCGEFRSIIREVNQQLLNEHIALKSLLSIRDVARTLSISVRTLETLLAEGKLPSPIWVGGQRRWHPDTIAAFLRSRQTKEGPR